MVINKAEEVCIMFRGGFLLLHRTSSEIPQKEYLKSLLWGCQLSVWIQMNRTQHFKWPSAQYPNIWFLIYANSKFSTVSESLLWTNVFMPGKVTGEVGFTCWVGRDLPSKMCKKKNCIEWRETMTGNIYTHTYIYIYLMSGKDVKIVCSGDE